MKRDWSVIARTAGIWISGIAAGFCIGFMIGAFGEVGYSTAEPGAYGGMAAFICFRLWMWEPRRPR